LQSREFGNSVLSPQRGKHIVDVIVGIGDHDH